MLLGSGSNFVLLKTVPLSSGPATKSRPSQTFFLVNFHMGSQFTWQPSSSLLCGLLKTGKPLPLNLQPQSSMQKGMYHKIPDLAQGSIVTKTSTTFYTLAPPWVVGQASSQHGQTWMRGRGSVAIVCSHGMPFSRMLLEPCVTQALQVSFRKLKCYPGKITL